MANTIDRWQLVADAWEKQLWCQDDCYYYLCIWEPEGFYSTDCRLGDNPNDKPEECPAVKEWIAQEE